jgi:hypothetical protein
MTTRIPGVGVSNILSFLKPSQFPNRVSTMFRDVGRNVVSNIVADFYSDLLILDPDVILDKYGDISEVAPYLYYLHPREYIVWIYQTNPELYKMLFVSLTKAGRDFFASCDENIIGGLPLAWMLNNGYIRIIEEFKTAATNPDHYTIYIESEQYMTFDEVVPSNQSTDFYNVIRITRSVRRIVSPSGKIRDSDLNASIYLLKNRKSDNILNLDTFINAIPDSFPNASFMAAFLIGLRGDGLDFTNELIIAAFRIRYGLREHELTPKSRKTYLSKVDVSFNKLLLSTSTSGGLDCVKMCYDLLMCDHGSQFIVPINDIHITDEIQEVCEFLLSKELVTGGQVLFIGIYGCIPSLIKLPIVRIEFIRCTTRKYPTEENAVKVFDIISPRPETAEKDDCLGLLKGVHKEYYFPSLIKPLFDSGINPDIRIGYFNDPLIIIPSDRINRSLVEVENLKLPLISGSVFSRTTFKLNLYNAYTHEFRYGFPSLSVGYLVCIKGIKFYYPESNKKLILLIEKFMTDRYK